MPDPTNPKKKTTTQHGPRKGITMAKADSFDRGQQLSDKLASRVAKGKMSYDQAKKSQSGQDKKATRSSVIKKTRNSSQGLASKTASTKPRYKLDSHGNKVAY